MTKVIAIGKDGTNLVFDLKKDALEHFCLTRSELDRRIENGKLAEDPRTGKKYFLDELVDIDTETEAPKCRETCDDWQDWD